MVYMGKGTHYERSFWYKAHVVISTPIREKKPEKITAGTKKNRRKGIITD